LNSERFPVLQRVEANICSVKLSLDLSGLSTEGGLDLLLHSPLVDIKLPAEPLRSLTLQRFHINDMIAGDALCRAILHAEGLSLEYNLPEELGLFLEKITGAPLVEGQSITFPHLRRLELRGSHGSLDMSLFNFPALRCLKLHNASAILRCENFPSLETLDCFYGNITLIGEFPELRSLNIQRATLGTESKFTAPLLQELSFGSAQGVSKLDVGRSTFPSLQVVSITCPSTNPGEADEKLIPHLAANDAVDSGPWIVLRMDWKMAQVFRKSSRTELPGWIVFLAECTLPENAGLD